MTTLALVDQFYSRHI